LIFDFCFSFDYFKRNALRRLGVFDLRVIRFRDGGRWRDTARVRETPDNPLDFFFRVKR